MERTGFFAILGFVSKEKYLRNNNWYKLKNYLHFDEPIDEAKAYKLVSNPNLISKHSFLPFLSFMVKSPKYQYDEKIGKKTITTKDREICYCSHTDSHIYSYYATILYEKYENILFKKKLESNVIAFRKIGDGKCNINFAYEAFNDIKQYNRSTVIALDFSKFFDSLNHDILKKQWCKIINKDKLPEDHFKVFKSLTKYAKVDKNKLESILCRRKNRYYRKLCTIKEFRDKVRTRNLISKNDSNIGIPQGSPLSGLLSNIYMLDFDERMKNYISKLNGKYYRYCDDILIIIPNIHNIKEVKKIAIEAIRDLEVNINDKKTEIRTFERNASHIKIKNKVLKHKSFHFINTYIKKDLITKEKKPLQYLGFLFDGRNIYIRSSSISRYYGKIRKGLLRAKYHMKNKNMQRKEKEYHSKPLFKNKLYEMYSHLGKSNFVTYARRCKNHMNLSQTINKQMKKFHKILFQRLNK